MIDPRLYSTELSFRLCLGPYGYDARSSRTNLSKTQTPIRLGPRMPCYLSFDKAKPCLSLQFDIEDLRYFMYAKNYLINSVKELVKEFVLNHFNLVTSYNICEKNVDNIEFEVFRH